MHSLPLFLMLEGRAVMLLGEGEMADARRRLIARAGGIIVGEADQTARIAFLTLPDPDALAVRLRARGLLLNVADRPDLCDFTMPAVVDRDPVIIAISTGGASAGLAAALRQRIEALLPARLGALARALGAARAPMRARWPDAAARRRALGAALAPGGLIDPLGAAPDIDLWLESGIDRAPSELYVLGLRSPDPDDLSLRDARMLALADRIVHPPGTPAAILDRARADAVRIPDRPTQDWSRMPGLTVILDVTNM